MQEILYYCDYCEKEIGTKNNWPFGTIIIDKLDIKIYLPTACNKFWNKENLSFCSLKCFLEYLYLRGDSKIDDNGGEDNSIAYAKVLENIVDDKRIEALLARIESIESDKEILREIIGKLKKERRELKKKINNIENNYDAYV